MNDPARPGAPRCEGYDLWSIAEGNRIVASADEALVRTIVRELLDSGWSPDNLSLGLPDGGVVEGWALVDWLAVAKRGAAGKEQG